MKHIIFCVALLASVSCSLGRTLEDKVVFDIIKNIYLQAPDINKNKVYLVAQESVNPFTCGSSLNKEALINLTQSKDLSNEEKEALQDFINKVHIPRKWAFPWYTAIPLEMLPNSEIETLRNQSWFEVIKKYPKVRNVSIISRVGISKNQKTALFYGDTISGYRSGGGGLAFYECTKGKWIETRYLQNHIY